MITRLLYLLYVLSKNIVYCRDEMRLGGVHCENETLQKHIKLSTFSLVLSRVDIGKTTNITLLFVDDLTHFINELFTFWTTSGQKVVKLKS